MASLEVTTAPAGWDAFCEASGWFWHTSHWRAYTEAYRPDLNSRSLAFAITDAGRIVAAAPMMLEEHPGRELSFGGAPCWAPAVAQDLPAAERQRVWRAVFDHVDELAAEHDVERAAIQLSPLSPSFADDAVAFTAAAIRAGYLDASRTSQVVDLAPDEAELRRQMSKGHRSAATREGKTFEAHVCHRETADDALFERYRAAHAAAAGRVTRPPITWELMRDWIHTGHGALVVAQQDGRPVSFAYLIVFGAGAYYTSAATDPDAGPELPGHLVQWTAMRWLRDAGIARYELGLQQFGPLPHDQPSEKELAIARFKRGFGGTAVPLLVRERYYSPRLWREVDERRRAAFLGSAQQ